MTVLSEALLSAMSAIDMDSLGAQSELLIAGGCEFQRVSQKGHARKKHEQPQEATVYRVRYGLRGFGVPPLGTYTKGERRTIPTSARPCNKRHKDVPPTNGIVAVDLCFFSVSASKWSLADNTLSLTITPLTIRL